VEDSGKGIKKESINKLFTKFERLDEKNTTIEGTGLGLAITKKLVELMNGKIVVQSVYGKGSKFTIIVDQRIISQEAVNLEPEVETEQKIKEYPNKKILVVDDNQLNLKVAARLLRDYKCQIEEVDSGYKVLDLIASGNKYDLILMDDMMPKLSGIDTLHRLKENVLFNIPVVALTANAISGMREKYLADGFDEYLAKPIEKNELNEIINKYLDK
jgi:CheY-like chemotaxis protein